MSQRSVFRYFPTKEDIVVGKIDFFADDLLVALRARPADEPVWESLRRGFDVADPEGDPGGQDTAGELHEIVFATPSLLGRYLERRQRPTPEAIAAAAFGCLVAAQRAWIAAGATEDFAAALDRAMASVGPAG
jgi:AcrR family transcriptional regulator